MNKESIEIINRYIRPDDSLVAQVKGRAVNSTEKKTYAIPLKAAGAFCLFILIALSFGVLNREGVAPVEESTLPKESAHYTTNADGNYEYSEMVDKNGLDESLKGYHLSACIDKACFNEELLVYSDCIAIVEAIVKDVRLKEYVIISECDKFEKNGTLTEKVDSLVCELDITKVWYGGLKENQTVTVETQLFSFDEVMCIKEGHRYVLPLCDSGDKISGFASSGPIISGDLTRESELAIIYAMQPQIEQVEGGYIFNSLWESLVCDECIKVEMDIELGEEAEFYRDKMLYLPEETFNDRFEIVVDNLSDNE